MNTLADRLRRARGEFPHLGPSVDLHLALIEARAAVAPLPPPVFSPSEVRALLERGTPLLAARPPEVNWETWTTLFIRVCDLAAHHRPDLAADFAALRDRAATPELREQAARYPRDGHLAAGDGADPALLTLAFVHAFYPTLRACAEALGPLAAEHEDVWYRPRCPVCGGEADFACLVAGSGARRLLCSRCDHEWAYQRVGCPYCGETNSACLGYYPAPDGRYRLYVCDACGRYLKVADFREISDPAPLPLERILTLDMDVAALDADSHTQ